MNDVEFGAGDSAYLVDGCRVTVKAAVLDGYLVCNDYEGRNIPEWYEYEGEVYYVGKDKLHVSAPTRVRDRCLVELDEKIDRKRLELAEIEDRTTKAVKESEGILRLHSVLAPIRDYLSGELGFAVIVGTYVIKLLPSKDILRDNQWLISLRGSPSTGLRWYVNQERSGVDERIWLYKTREEAFRKVCEAAEEWFSLYRSGKRNHLDLKGLRNIGVRIPPDIENREREKKEVLKRTEVEKLRAQLASAETELAEALGEA